MSEAADFNEYRRSWRKANPDKMRAQYKRYYDNNKEKVKAKNRAGGPCNRVLGLVKDDPKR